ncbi:MAG: hypothetical protein U0271_09425 [Polyangiaceae bacterium]
MATMEPLPAKYACATLTARGHKLRKVPRRTADTYAKCKAVLDAPAGDLQSCVELARLLEVAPRDEVLSDNVAARACARGNRVACRRLALGRLDSGARFDPICAASLLDTLCGEGDLSACFRLGTLKVEGELAVQDVAAGEALVKRACDEGEYMACLDIVERGAHKLVGGQRPSEMSDEEKRRIVEGAFTSVTKACSLDDADACLELGRAYSHAGQWYYLASQPADEAKSVAANRRACNLGLEDACSELERDQRTDTYKDDCDESRMACAPPLNSKDPDQYPEWIFHRCAAGWDSACEGLRLSLRVNRSKDPAVIERRTRVLETGCLEGAAGACSFLLVGKLGPFEPSEAFLKTGCELGVAESCRRLATKAGATGDHTLELEYLELGCPVVTPLGGTSTSRLACRLAGLMYKDGVGTQPDLGRAAILLQKGCVERRYVLDGESCLVLGTMFESGLGVEKNLARALDLYAAGCADENYMDIVRSRAERRRSPNSPPLEPKPERREPSACARLRASESGGAQ